MDTCIDGNLTFDGHVNNIVWKQADKYNALSVKHTEADTKSTPFRKRLFKCIFLNWSVQIFIKTSLKFVPKDPINNIPALLQISEPMMIIVPTHICVTRPQWVNWHARKKGCLQQLHCLQFQLLPCRHVFYQPRKKNMLKIQELAPRLVLKDLPYDDAISSCKCSLSFRISSLKAMAIDVFFSY